MMCKNGKKNKQQHSMLFRNMEINTKKQLEELSCFFWGETITENMAEGSEAAVYKFLVIFHFLIYVYYLFDINKNNDQYWSIITVPFSEQQQQQQYQIIFVQCLQGVRSYAESFSSVILRNPHRYHLKQVLFFRKGLKAQRDFVNCPKLVQLASGFAKVRILAF